MEQGNSFNLLQYLGENPVESNAGIGLVSGLLQQPQQQAMLQSEIAKTQYSPWTGTGPGNISPYLEDKAASGTVKGFTAGLMQQQKQEREQRLIDALTPSFKSAKPAETNQVASSDTSTPSPYMPEESTRALSPMETQTTPYPMRGRSLNESQDIILDMFKGTTNPYGNALPQGQGMNVSPYAIGRRH